MDMLDLEELQKKIYLVQTDEIIDWSREGDDLIMQVKSWVAAKERDKIRDRLAAGRERVKRGENPKHRGKGWNSWKVKPIDMREVERYRTMGVPITFIAERMGVHRDTLYKRMKKKA